LLYFCIFLAFWHLSAKPTHALRHELLLLVVQKRFFWITNEKLGRFDTKFVEFEGVKKCPKTPKNG
jgi:hypothetical protein